MNDAQIERCRSIISREEKLVRSAPNEVAAELHRQKASLYRTRLALLTRGIDRVPKTSSL